MPQLMRMVLNESLKALKTQGWEERLVLVAHPESSCLAWASPSSCHWGVGVTRLSLSCHKDVSAFTLRVT